MITRRDFIRIAAAGGALASVGEAANARTMFANVLPNMDLAREGGRHIPVIAEADLVVAGGSSRAVALAKAAARTGCRVFLIAEMPYLGDDICGSFMYDRAEGEQPMEDSGRKVFASGAAYPSPLHVKTALEHELIDYNVDFLYSSIVTEALTNDEGAVAGLVITNRSGRQAIRCRAVADCTHTASVASFFGAERIEGKGPVEFAFVTAGGSVKQHKSVMRAEVLPRKLSFGGKEWPLTRYTFSLETDGSYASVAGIEQTIRSAVWDADQVDSSDLLWYHPLRKVRCRQNISSIGSLRSVPEQVFMPLGIDNLWVVGPCAGLSREAAAEAMRPLAAMLVGSLLGDIIGRKAINIPDRGTSFVRHKAHDGYNYGEIGETLHPLRPARNMGYVASHDSALPILGSYDVIVLGGGTAGATAAVSAARQGVKTLEIEYLHGLGGLGTLGRIGRYWDGYREGFTSEMDKAVRQMAPDTHPRQRSDWQEESVADWKAEWLRREFIGAGGELWFGAMGCGALSEHGTVKGIVVATPEGRGLVFAKVVIDSTGSADIAIAAGAAYDYTGSKTLAVQGAGTGYNTPGSNYINNDWLFVDDTDILDVSRAYVQGKVKAKGQYDLIKLPQTRERRRIIAEHIVSVSDVLTHRRYEDTISYHRSSFDTHGMIVDPYFILSPPMERHSIYDADVPLRSLLPKGLEGILVTGLGAGAHRDAMPVIRMRSCLQTQGHSVGYLAATAVRENKPLRKVDIKKIQKHLVEIGNLPARVLTDKEFRGFDASEMHEAAMKVTNNYEGLEILLTDHRRCIHHIRKRFDSPLSESEALVCASVLCILGESSHAAVVEQAIASAAEWDKGWHYTGMGQFGMSLSPLDALITALGRARQASSLPYILSKARQLTPDREFSHYRAVCKASEAIADPAAAPVLAELLCAPGMRGHSIAGYADARRSTVPDTNDVSVRNIALKELHLAGALYLCGDHEGTAEAVLRAYAEGLQGHYARYATEILAL
ncbi:MAG: FAD-dependent oxidoreductase [Tannerellaceae bacterium]|jgi:NADPH-dependent 2,4-dienoyl-CoA reductase/sulfur reductase-like enzyme|nr:FAD-dependent oxidoreductase [Tannerellaceae bacterium]